MEKLELYEYIKNNMFNKNNQWKSTAYFKHITDDLFRLQKEGETFNEKLYLFFYKKKPRRCNVCNKPTSFIKLSQGYRKYCSTKCSANSKEKQNRTKQTNLKKHGVEFFVQTEKHKKLVREKYLNKLKDENYNDEIIKKRRKTVREKYGVDNVNLVEEINNKRIKTSKDKYGKNNYNNREKAKKTKLKNYYENLLYRTKEKVIPLFDLNDYINVEKLYKWKCSVCGNEFTDHLDDGHIPRCKKCFPNKSGMQSSFYEEEIKSWLNEINIQNIIMNDRTKLYPQEIDIYLPDYNLAIEINGLYWHSELNGKDKNYHLNKTIECQKKGIQLIHIFEDEWLNKKETVKSIIKTKLGIMENKVYARKCVVKELENKHCKDFLDKNHLQGYVSAKINIGLYYEDDLVCLLSLGKPRFNKKYDWEILRWANKLNFSIVGGFSKLLKHFRKNYKGSIITYSDRRFFDGKIYKKNGFKAIKASKPSYYYTEHHYRKNREKFQKHRIKDKLDVFDPNLTEWQNMQLNGWDRIWDCGNNVFILE